MTRAHVACWLVLGAALAAGCGGKDTSPPAVPRAPGGAAYEPTSFCFTGAQTAEDTLTVYNLGAEILVWTPVSVPAGSAGLDAVLNLDPETGRALPWTWNPSGAYPIRDSLVVETNDPLRPRVVIRVRRDDPSGSPDVTPPDAPLLFEPADGDTFTLAPAAGGGNEATIPVAWSELDDCSGIARYRLEIATSPTFGASRVFVADTTATAVVVVAEDGDAGTAYWRVTAMDNQGLQGLPSQVRSWVVLPAP